MGFDKYFFISIVLCSCLIANASMSSNVNSDNSSYAYSNVETLYTKMTSLSKSYDLYSLTQDENLKILLKDLEDKPIKPKKQISRKIMTEISIFVTTLICFSGIIGNLLSLKVFFSTKMPRTSSRTYLIALTICDCIFLGAHFIDDTCKQIVDYFELEFPINITDQKLSMCRGFALVRSMFRAASPWIIVAFTLERFLIVNYPHKSNIIAKPLLAKRFVYFILLVSFLISLYAPILTGIVFVPTQLKKMTTSNKNLSPFFKSLLQSNTYYQQRFYRKTCDVLEDYRIVYLYFTFFYTLIIIILPLVIVSLFNTLLIIKLYKSTDKWTSAKLKLHDQEMSYKELRDKKVQIENLKITWTLVIISLSFIFLTLPHLIFYFIISIKLVKSSSVYVIYKLTELFYIFNHSSNILLYVVTRKSFRRVLKQKLDCGCFNLRKKMNLNRANPPFLTTSILNRNKDKPSVTVTPPVQLNYLNVTNNSTKLKKSNDSNEANQLLSNKNAYSENNNNIDYESYWETAKLKPDALTLPNKMSKKTDNKNLKLVMLNTKNKAKK